MRIKDLFFQDRNCWILWLPVFFTIGIITYLSIDYKICVKYSFTFLALISFAIIIFNSNKLIQYFLVSILFIILGFLTISYRVKSVDAPILNYEIKYAEIEGKILSVIPLPIGYKIIIENPRVKNHEQLHLKKVRINIKTDLENIKIGDKISLKAALSPPPKATIIGGYNFAFFAYFEQIGAVGYSLSKIKISEKNPSNLIANIRRKMSKSIIDILGSKKGNIATALMIGEYNGIDKKILTDMRISGISHILSVSGMHLSLAAAIFLFASRIILNFIPYFVYHSNVKKIASIFAIIGSFGYLLISGMQIAAIRSFIMTFMIISAIAIDRLSTPMRSVMFAFFLLLLLYPESIANPSFQMSFAAVIALISCYEFYTEYSPSRDKDTGFIMKIAIYVLSSLFSSVIAGIATAPYAAYHFNQFSGYGVITNLLAVPVTSFLIMPMVIIAFILYPISLHKLPLIIMGYGIDILIYIADYIADLPYSVSKISFISPACLILITLAGFWFSLWQSKIRVLAFIPLIASILLYYKTPLPIIITSPKSYGFISNDKFIFNDKTLSKFTREEWLNHYGQEELLYYKQPMEDYFCESEICEYIYDEYKILFVKEKLPNVRQEYDLTIDYASNDFSTEKYINAKDDNYMIYDKLKIISVNKYFGDYPWNK